MQEYFLFLKEEVFSSLSFNIIVTLLIWSYVINSIIEMKARRKRKIIDSAIKLGFTNIEFNKNDELVKIYNEKSDK